MWLTTLEILYKDRITVEKFRDNYSDYIDVVKTFMKEYGIEFNKEVIKDYKDLDKYLWIFGKNLSEK